MADVPHDAEVVGDEQIGEPVSRCRSPKRSRTLACVDRSSALTGSSQTISFGSRASARAIATRCRCPPENSPGYRADDPAGIRTWSRSEVIRREASADAPAARSGSARIDCTVIAGFREEYGSWKTTWMWLLRARRARPFTWVMSRPWKCTDPDLTAVSPRMALPSVDLPDPDSPTRPSARRSECESRYRGGRETAAPGSLSRGK